MKKPSYDKWSIGNAYGSYSNIPSSAGTYTEGQFVNKKHTVLAYAEDKYIYLRIFDRGICYSKKVYTKKLASHLSISMQASKFSKEIGGKQ